MPDAVLTPAPCQGLLVGEGEGRTLDDTGNHGVEKVVKKGSTVPVESGLPSPEASYHLPTGCHLPTQERGYTG